MPFYVSPDDDEPVVPFDDLSMGTGRAIIDGNEKRFVALMAHGHVVGFDLKELDRMIRNLVSAADTLTELMVEDARKNAPSEAGTPEPQTTQFNPSDGRPN